MKHSEAISIVENLLLVKTKNYQFKTSSEMLAYQRGFLTSLLATLVSQDNFTQHKIEKLYEKTIQKH